MSVRAHVCSLVNVSLGLALSYRQFGRVTWCIGCICVFQAWYLACCARCCLPVPMPIPFPCPSPSHAHMPRRAGDILHPACVCLLELVNALLGRAPKADCTRVYACQWLWADLLSIVLQPGQCVSKLSQAVTLELLVNLSLFCTPDCMCH